MEKKINETNKKLKQQDKPGFHRAKGKQPGLTKEEKAASTQKNDEEDHSKKINHKISSRPGK